MILVGQLDSPFVRRVAVTLGTYRIPFEQRPLSVFADFAQVCGINPLGQVPALVLDDGETLFDSPAILDHLDQQVAPPVRLVPAEGADRRRVLRWTAAGLGAAAKAVALSAERRRRERGSYDGEWAARLESQIAAALAWLDGQDLQPWLLQTHFSQADVTAACAFTYVERRHPDLVGDRAYPALRRLTDACEALPAFRAARFPDT